MYVYNLLTDFFSVLILQDLSRLIILLFCVFHLAYGFIIYPELILKSSTVVYVPKKKKKKIWTFIINQSYRVPVTPKGPIRFVVAFWRFYST